MKKLFKLNLQFFAGEGTSGASGASGAGSAAGGEAASGDNATVDAGQRLRELGVPEDKLRRRAKYAAKPAESAAKTAEKAEGAENNEQAAAAENPAEDKKTEAPARMSWDEIMADPEYNKQMQAVVQSRLKSAKGAEEALGKVTPALELLARKYDLDPANIDYEALAKKISDDDDYYEEAALSMGVSVETAKKVDQLERDTARRQREEARNLEDQKLRSHFNRLVRQSEAMKTVFPNFNLQKELQNPVFARMTHPDVGISVEDAYYAVHRNEIQTAAMKATAQQTAQQISNSIQAGRGRPDEAGASGQAPSVTTFNYKNASREQQLAFKADIRARMARGEKVYPGSR